MSKSAWNLCDDDAQEYFYLLNKYTANQTYRVTKATTASQSSAAYFALVFDLA